jgi:dCMP deaminase
LNPVNYDCQISESEHDRDIIQLALTETEYSPDWWRQVGAILVKDGKILYKVHNTHLPTEQNPYYEGDPRDFVKAGVSSEIATSMHCEAWIVAEAARTGTSLEGTDLSVTDFTCPLCAKLVAHSGIKRLFFRKGHASVDGESILKEKGVQIIWVKPN